MCGVRVKEGERERDVGRNRETKRKRDTRVVTLTNDGGERTHSSLTRPVAPQ